MEKISTDQKNTLRRTYATFQLKGLQSYAKYLEKEFKNSLNKEHKKAYHQYIVSELDRNSKQIEKVKSKLD